MTVLTEQLQVVYQEINDLFERLQNPSTVDVLAMSNAAHGMRLVSDKLNDYICLLRSDSHSPISFQFS